MLGLILITYVVDPYDVHPWGLPPRIASHRYPDVEWPLLLKVVSQEDHRLVMIGASTFMPVSTRQLRAVFGSQTKPTNLAYPYAAPGDIKLVADTVAAMPSVRRVLFVMDHSMMMDMHEKGTPAALRDQVFASNWSNAGDFRWDTLVASWNRLVHGTYDRPLWARHSDTPDFFAVFRPLTTDRRAMTRLRAALERHRGDVFGAPLQSDCSQYPFLSKVLIPSLAAFRMRGIAVDLVFPPYPYVGYYDWIDRRTSNDPFRAGPVFPQLIEFKRCVVTVAERSGARVTVHAMDNDEMIAGHLSNYADDVHIIRPALFMRVLEHVRNRDDVLTSANFDQFERELQARVAAATLAN
jgi:hypothetical protein